MTAELYSIGHAAFCRNPLHPGPCKGWKRGIVQTSKGVVTGREERTTTVTPPEFLGTPSRTGRADIALAPAVMDKDWKAHTESLSPAQSQVSYQYTGNYHTVMNRMLREPPGEPPKPWTPAGHVAADAETLQSAMAPAPRGTKVFRGMNSQGLGIEGEPTRAAMDALLGKTLINDAFTSTTVDRRNSFYGNVKLEIEVPKGTPSLWMGSRSQNPGEEELILAAGAKMRVIGVEPDPNSDGNWIVKGRIVP